MDFLQAKLLVEAWQVEVKADGTLLVRSDSNCGWIMCGGRRTDPLTATPWLRWSSGDVQEESGEAIEISYILPENRSVGV